MNQPPPPWQLWPDKFSVPSTIGPPAAQPQQQSRPPTAAAPQQRVPLATLSSFNRPAPVRYDGFEPAQGASLCCSSSAASARADAAQLSRAEKERLRRAAETREQTEARLAADRERHSKRRDSETADEHEARLADQRRRQTGMRDSETPAERDARLAVQRDADRAAANAERRRGLATAAEIAAAAAATLVAADDAKQADITDKVSDFLSDENVGVRVCAVCDRTVLKRDSFVSGHVCEAFVSVLGARLSRPPGMPALLAQYYDCSSVLGAFAPLLLSPRAFTHDAAFAQLHPQAEVDQLCACGRQLPWHGRAGRALHALRFPMCHQCGTALSANTSKPPKFAIANGLAIGAVPLELADLSWHEWQMVALSMLSGIVETVSPVKHNKIRSHITVFECTPGPAATMLPAPVETPVYFVRFTSRATSAEVARKLRAFDVRRAKLVAALTFFLHNNPLYAGVAVNQPMLGAMGAAADADAVVARPGVSVEYDVVALGGAEAQEAERLQNALDDQRPIGAAPFDELDDGHGAVDQAERELTHVSVCVDPIDKRTTADKAAEFVVRRSTLIDSADDFVLRAFSHLLPFGSGGPTAERAVPMSLGAWTRHVLQLSGRHFARDPLFPLVLFDKIGLRTMMSKVSLTVRLKPDVIGATLRLTPQGLAAGLRADEVRAQAAREGRLIGAPPATGPQAVPSEYDTVMRTLKAARATLPGGDAQRDMHSRHMQCYLVAHGPPTLFVTIAPNDQHDLTIAFYAGAAGAGLGIDDLLGSAAAQLAPAARMQIAVGDPVACATRFTIIMEAIELNVIGWDPKRNGPVAGGGAFGLCKAFASHIEAQDRGALHAHMLVWLYGTLATAEVAARYVDSISAAHIGLTTTSCPDCGTDDAVAPLSQNSLSANLAQARQKGTTRQPLVARCATCSERFTSSDLLNNALAKQRTAVGEENLPDISAIVKSPRPVKRARSASTPVTAVEQQQWRLVDATTTIDAQQHDFRHRPSCNKRGGTSCRYGIPVMTHVGATAIVDGEIVLHRPPGNEYINKRSIILTQLFPGSNNDLRLLLVLCVVTCICYAVSYVAKRQNDGSGVTEVMVSQFKRINERQAAAAAVEAANAANAARDGVAVAPAVDAATAEMRRAQAALCSLVHASSSKEQFAATMVCYLLAGHTICRSSHEMAPLLLGQVLDVLDGNAVDAMLLPVRGAGATLNGSGEDGEDVTLVPTTQFDEYVRRPSSLESVCLYDFVARFKRAGDRSSKKRAVADADGAGAVEERSIAVVPDLIGPSLPDITAVDQFRALTTAGQLVSADVDKKARKFAMMVLALWCPFRSRDALLGRAADAPALVLVPTLVWISAFDRFVAALPATDNRRALLANAQVWRQSRAAARANREAAAAFGDGRLADDDAAAAGDDLGAAAGDGGDAAGAAPLNDEALEAAAARALERSIAAQLADATVEGGANIVPSFAPPLIAALRDDVVAAISAASIDARLQQVRRGDSAGGDGDVLGVHAGGGGAAPPPLTLPSMPRPLLVQRIDLQLAAPVPFQLQVLSDADQLRFRATPRISLADCATLFTLNYEQRHAFFVVGKLLLGRLRRTLVPGQPHEYEGCVYIGGAGGCGKSRVVDALTHLARSWGAAERVLVAAFTGSAAVLVGGGTLHSSLGLSLFGAGFTDNDDDGGGGGNKRGKANAAHDARAARLRLLDVLILDEVSMVSAEMLHQVDVSLRASRASGEPFGGVVVVAMGDFFQLSPVAAMSLASSRAPPGRGVRAANAAAGRNLWLSHFTQCVFLVRNMRALADPQFAAILERARVGALSDGDVDLLNRQLVTPAAPFAKPANEFVPTLVSTNAARHSLNRLDLARAARTLPPGSIMRFEADIKEVRNGAALTPQLLALLHAQPDSKQSSGMLGTLDMYAGMSLMVTTNVATQLGLANGAPATFVCCAPMPDSDWEMRDVEFGDEQGRFNATVRVARILPPFVLVRLLRQPLVPFGAELPADIVPVAPLRNKRITVKIGGSQRSFSMAQLPLVSNNAITVHKAQGVSAANVVIADFGGSDAMATYVALSRARTLAGVHLAVPITPRVVARSTPPLDLFDEVQRLQALQPPELRPRADVAQDERRAHIARLAAAHALLDTKKRKNGAPHAHE